MDQSSIASSSFYEKPEEYDEGKTMSLYENLKKNFEDINETLGSVEKDMRYLQRQSVLTVKLIEKIKTAEAESSQNSTQR